MFIPVLQCMRNGINVSIGIEFPGTCAKVTKIPSDPKLGWSAHSVQTRVYAAGSRLTQSQGRDLVSVVQGDDRDRHDG